jgi:hypothetical protein
MKMRNGANSAWISLYELDGTFLASDISLAAGSAAAPSLFFTGDTNTGLFSPGADTVALATAGSNRLHITSGGLVGIGTSSPSAKAEIVSSGSESTLILRNSSASLSTYSELKFAPFTGTTAAAAAIRAEYYANNASSLDFRTTDINAEPVTRLFINAAGSVGIGTTSPAYALDVNSSVAQIGNSTDAFIQYKSSAGNWHVGAVSSNAFAFYSGTYGSGIERARIDSSGRLLVGTSSARSNIDYHFGTGASKLQLEQNDGGPGLSIIHNWTSGTNEVPGLLSLGRSGASTIGSNTIVANNNWLGAIEFLGSDGFEFTRAASIKAEVDGTPGTNDMPGRLVFSTTADGASSPTERMRINAAGALKASTNGTYLSSSDAANEIVQSNGSAPGLSVYTSSTSYIGSVLGISCNRNTTNNTYYFIDASVIGVAYRFRVADSGNVTNANNSYGAISDRKLKENIVDAASQWNDIKALQVRKYNFKEETGQPTHAQIGLIAQEVELISPGLVSESPDRDEDGNDLGTVTKSVNYSVLYMKAVKALQEAMERIEALEADVAALKGA